MIKWNSGKFIYIRDKKGRFSHNPLISICMKVKLLPIKQLREKRYRILRMKSEHKVKNVMKRMYVHISNVWREKT